MWMVTRLILSTKTARDPQLLTLLSIAFERPCQSYLDFLRGSFLLLTISSFFVIFVAVIFSHLDVTHLL